MSKRKYDTSNMTQTDLAEIERLYPKANAVETIRRPNYRIIAMLMDCGLPVPGVVRIGTEADEIQADPDLPPLLREKH